MVNLKRYSSERINVLSSGGGTQSCAMICLIHQGKIPKPDLIVMVDTEREISEAIDYQHNHMIPLCKDMGVDYHIIKKSEYTNDDIQLASAQERGSDDNVLPGFFVTNENGEMGKGPGFCSGAWKSTVIKRHINRLFTQKEATRRGVTFWMGMTIDEMRRVKTPLGKWQKWYPLVELAMHRQSAIQLVEDYNLPTPPRSACWMCPNRHNNEWAHMQDNCPIDFARAVAFERDLIARFPQYRLTKNDNKLLGDIDFIDDGRGSQMDLLQFCDSGMCFT
mgnify:CR=1 FL=1